MPTPVNKKVDKKFTERIQKHVEKNPIRKTAKVLEVDEKAFGMVSVVRPTSELLIVRLKALI